MSAVWVQMCFCLLFLDDFHSVLRRARSPGQEAPLPLCAGENVANLPGYDLQGGVRSTLLHFDLRTWNLFLTSEHDTEKPSGFSVPRVLIISVNTWQFHSTLTISQ